MTNWDAQRGVYRLEPLQDFGPEVNGRRSVNGGKNAGLLWSYKPERGRMYFPR